MIVTRNRPRFTVWALDALCLQRDVDLEVVVVDDASSPDIAGAIAPFREKLNIRLVRLASRIGCAGARNIGIRECSREVIVQLDDDSRLIEPDALSRLAAHLLANPRIGALALPVFNPWSRRPDGVGDRYQRWQGQHGNEEHSFHGCGVVLRRTAALEAGAYPQEFEYGGQEDFLAARLIDKGWRIEFYDRCRVVHGDEVLSRAEPGEADEARKQVFHGAHLVVTAWLLLPAPLHAFVAALRFGAFALHQPIHARETARRVVMLGRRMRRTPMRWRTALHATWLRLRSAMRTRT